MKKVIIAIILLVVGILISTIYSPYIQQNQINDYQIGNFVMKMLQVPFLYLIMSVITERRYFARLSQPVGVLLIMSSVAVAWELINSIYDGFSLLNLCGILLGALITFLFVKTVRIKHQE